MFVAPSCPTLCNPMDCSLTGSSVHGILQAIVLEWIAISFSRGSSQSRTRTWVSHIVDFTHIVALPPEPLGIEHQFSSVAQLCLTLCDPMNCSTPGLPVHHQLPEFTQTHVHRVTDAIQPSHPLSSPSPAPNPSQHQSLSNESTLCMRWPKYWSFSFSIIPSKEIPELSSFRMDWLDLLSVQGLSGVFSNTAVQKHQFFGTQPSSQSNSHIHT